MTVQFENFRIDRTISHDNIPNDTQSHCTVLWR